MTPADTTKAEPSVEEQLQMAAEREAAAKRAMVRKKLTAAGFHCLTDDEVIDMGDYVIPKKFELSRTYDSNSGTLRQEAEYGYYDLPGTYDVEHRQMYRMTCYPEKPLLVDVTICDKYSDPGLMGSHVRRYFVPKTGAYAGDQMVAYVSSDGTTGVERTRGRIRFLSTDYAIVKPARLTSMHRKLLRLAELRVSQHATKAADLASAIYNKLHDICPSVPTAHWRDGVVISSPGSFRRVRSALQVAGYLIAQAESDPDEEAFIESLNTLGDYLGRDRIEQIVTQWNARTCLSPLIRASCGHIVPEDETQEVHRGEVCRDCFDSDYVYCEGTEDYRHQGGVYYHEEDDCYRTYPEDSDDDDDDEDDHPAVRNYSTDVTEILERDDSIKPSSHGDFLMGIELEVVPGRRKREESVDDTMRTLCSGYAILKNDGSLNDGGFEIVTAPRGLTEHIRRFKEWKPHTSLRSWDTGCCGMHVHISSQAFTPISLGKFIEFINSPVNDGLIKEIAGRHPTTDVQCQRYCQRDGDVVAANPKATLNSKTTSRYYMVNTSNLSSDESYRLFGNSSHAIARDQDTIELRVFRGTLKKERLLAQIEFAHAAVMFCRVASFRALGRDDFLKWLRNAAGLYPNLAKWFGVRANTEVVDAKPKVRELAEI